MVTTNARQIKRVFSHYTKAGRMRYSIGDVITKQSLVFGKQYVRVTNKTANVNRRGHPGFLGVAVNEKGDEIRINDPYGNKVWGFNHEIIDVHIRAV